MGSKRRIYAISIMRSVKFKLVNAATHQSHTLSSGESFHDED
jgi:hypothetical protein